MLDPKGNTAVYMLYAYTRISSISRKANLSAEAIEEARQEENFVCCALNPVQGLDVSI